jgi:hypothetical protein
MTDGQPASLSWHKASIWDLRPDLYYLCDSYGLVLVGRPLWQEDGSVFYICCWLLPAQSFFGLSPLGLATIFYCLTFETSLSVASYDSQGHGGGIRSCLHTGRCNYQLSWCPCYITSALAAQKTLLPRILLLLSDMLSGLLPSDNPGIVDEGVCFGWCKNVFTGRCLPTDNFLC